MRIEKKERKFSILKGHDHDFQWYQKKELSKKKMQFNSTLAKWRHQYDIFFSVKIVEYVNFKDVELLKKKNDNRMLEIKVELFIKPII